MVFSLSAKKQLLQRVTAVTGLDLINANHNYRTTSVLSLRQRRVNQTNAGPGKLTDTGVIIPACQATTAVSGGF
jgi:hypothetical protein